MNIIVNDKPQAIPDETPLLMLLKKEGYDADAPIAVAVNQKIIIRSQWEQLVLKTDDVIDIVSAIPGG
jgi:thiamine biosynthesis protein ThiS